MYVCDVSLSLIILRNILESRSSGKDYLASRLRLSEAIEPAFWPHQRRKSFSGVNLRLRTLSFAKTERASFQFKSENYNIGPHRINEMY